MLNSGWTRFNSNVGRSTLGSKVEKLASILKVPEKKFIVQKADFDNSWSNLTPPVSEGMAEDIIKEMRAGGDKGFFRIQEVK